MSGKPFNKQSQQNLIQYIHDKTNGQITIIGSGGIFTGNDAKEKTKQVHLHYCRFGQVLFMKGPAIVKNICNDLSCISNNLIDGNIVYRRKCSELIHSRFTGNSFGHRQCNFCKHHHGPLRQGKTIKSKKDMDDCRYFSKKWIAIGFGLAGSAG